jgi:putative sterol carrier protein
MELENIDELKKGYEKYLKIKERTLSCSKKWIKEHPENARRNNKTYYDKIKETDPEKYREMIKKKVEQHKIRVNKKIELEKEKKVPQYLSVLYNI